jgi:hypothetical protein
MSKFRVIALAAGAATLLITTGTAVALTSTDDPTPSRPAASVETSLTTESTDPTSGTTEPTETSETTGPTAPAEATGREQAIRAALASTGGGVVTQVERELEHGRAEWKIRIVKDGVRIDVRIDAATATVTRIDGGGDDRRSGGDDGRHSGGDDQGSHGGDESGGDDSGGHRGRH